MRLVFLWIIIVTGSSLFAQSDLRKVAIEDLPENVKEISDISSALQWTDSLGNNLLIITKRVFRKGDENTAPANRHTRPNYNRYTIPSFAHCFQLIEDSAILRWKVAGISRLCQDETINHTQSWHVVTDLNNNGRAEVWIIHKGPCVSEETGGSMKIIMHEGYWEYIMDGYIIDTVPSEYNLDANFRKGPPEFRRYALQLWHHFLKDQ